MLLREVINRFKAKLGRYYKFIKPFIKVLLRISLVDKKTASIISYSKKQPKHFFKAKVYNLKELNNVISSNSDGELQKDDIRELIEILPLLLSNIAITKERWYLGKIESQPFDIFMAPERLVKIIGKKVDIYQGLYIQTKRLYRYPPKEMTIEEWSNSLASIIKEKISNVDFGHNGHFHFYNLILLNPKVSMDELKQSLRKIHIPYNKFIDSMSISIPLVNPKQDVTTMTWYIYPLIHMVGIFDLDLEKARGIYSELDLSKIALDFHKSKEFV